MPSDKNPAAYCTTYLVTAPNHRSPKGIQEDYAVRGTLTSSNAMRIQFNSGDDFTEAPDVIGINILGFQLPELKTRKMFCSRIVRAEYESRRPFLADKYSDYYVEIPKMTNWTKGTLPEEYHDLWDLCCIFRAKIKDHEEVIRMQSIKSPSALELSEKVRKTVAPNDFVHETLDRKDELEQLQNYMLRREQKVAAEAAQKEKEAAQKEAAQKEKAAQKMVEDVLGAVTILETATNFKKTIEKRGNPM